MIISGKICQATADIALKVGAGLAQVGIHLVFCQGVFLLELVQLHNSLAFTKKERVSNGDGVRYSKCEFTCLVSSRVPIFSKMCFKMLFIS